MAQLRAALYARVSTDDQDCRRQVGELTAWAERCGWQIVSVAQESASGAKVDRLERRRLVDMAHRREIDLIAISELSRWSRSVTDLMASLEQLAADGVSVKALNGLDMDLSSPMGRLMVTLIGGVAEFERSLIAERTRSGVAAAKARGVRFGRRLGDRPTDKLKALVASTYAQQSSLRKTARLCGCSVTTVRRLLG